MCSRKAKHTQDGVAFFCEAKNAGHSAAVIKLTPNIRKSSRELADQLSRAAISITCNLSEGSGRSGKDRTHFYRIAFGSIRECQGLLLIISSLNILPPNTISNLNSALDELAAVTYRLKF